MNNYLLIVLLTSFIYESSNSQINTDSLQLYHPLHQGDFRMYRYVYKYLGNADTSYKSEKVLSDTVINSYHFFAVGMLSSKHPTNIEPTEIIRFERYDTTTSKYYWWDPDGYEILRDITSIGIGNYSWGNVSFTSIAGQAVLSRVVSYASPTSASGATYAWGLGMYSNWSWNNFGLITETTLIYANINGHIFGVYPLNVAESSKMLGQSILLSQNYPNPFNSQTTIVYNINRNYQINLFLYDVLGREVMNYLIGEKTAGTHSEVINFEHLPSGIYYYRLIVGNTSLIKKLTYIK